ncbi:MAG TPA: hypothetical protein DEQ34_02260 [Balneolaceae bacterium]|nr:hypothetical protein [Balneolaceae bacterium]|tara:strand:- start:86335 stop:87477 length:1143 start_codon:yes stop_codon:yes gene_type:complete
MSFGYSEDILQWVWQQQLLNKEGLRTTGGKPVKILDPGKLNTTDGPDFLNAKIQIGPLTLHGAVELHVHAGDWFRHQHHLDENYNTVILHVIAGRSEKIHSNDGAIPDELNLLSHIDQELSRFLKAYYNKKVMPCSGTLSYLSEDAFEQQLKKAGREYFEEKTNTILRFYNPDKGPYSAFKDALIMAVFDGFGITHNRESMRETAEWLIREQCFEKYEHALEKAASFAFGTGNIKWNRKGVRPHNRPEKRLKEAVALSFFVYNISGQELFSTDFNAQWNDWIRRSGLKRSHRSEILYGTVFLPAKYLLGSLFHDAQLMKASFEAWMSLEAPVPEFIIKQLSGIPGAKAESYQNKLGSVYQLRSYCKKKRCSECEVLKKII